MNSNFPPASNLAFTEQNELLSPLTPEQTLLWLDSQRAWMFEVWKKNPQLRKRFTHLKRIK